jgi:polyhydroxybutyrate depolymerase
MRSRALTTLPIGLLLAGLVTACSGEDGEDASAGSTATTAADTPTTTVTVTVTAEPHCTDGALDGRSYILCTPGDPSGEGLVVALHGRGSSAAEMRAMTGLETYAGDRGLAVVYPDGLDGGWGDDTLVTPDRPAGDEDVTFLDALIESLRSDPGVGDGPVGIVGFSNGASMALRYAGARPDEVRAVVSVAGQLPRDPAIRPTGRVPLLQIYGTADPVRPYDTGIPAPPVREPGSPTPTLSTTETVAAFVGPADHEGPEATDPDPGDGTSVSTERWTDRQGTLAVRHTILGGGHTWPSADAAFTGSPRFGPVSTDVDASAAAVAFIVDPDSPEGQR